MPAPTPLSDEQKNQNVYSTLNTHKHTHTKGERKKHSPQIQSIHSTHSQRECIMQLTSVLNITNSTRTDYFAALQTGITEGKKVPSSELFQG